MYMNSSPCFNCMQVTLCVAINVCHSNFKVHVQSHNMLIKVHFINKGLEVHVNTVSKKKTIKLTLSAELVSPKYKLSIL